MSTGRAYIVQIHPAGNFMCGGVKEEKEVKEITEWTDVTV